MRLYNTLTRSLEPFTPFAPPKVSMYVCGPTVYDVPHIGHARSAFTFDVLRRYLAHKGYHVTFVRNVTDVDDKIIEKARQELAISSQQSAVSKDLKRQCREVAEKYLRSYHETMDRLGIGRPDIEPKATEHVVPEMTDFISKLLVQAAAYEVKNGDVYFAVRKFADYGRLSNRSIDELQAGVRIEPGEQKQDPLDFALWKAAKPEEPSWKSPWGPGRPGWHIECSTMSTKYLGDQFDIHGGGVDLVFPHHENEIAQARAAGKPFARMWVHNGLLTVNGEKMSKSLGNYATVEQALTACEGQVDTLKAFFLGAHYRSPIDYSPDNLRASATRLQGWLNVIYRAELWRTERSSVEETSPEIDEHARAFERAMDEDLNTPAALAALDGLAAYGSQVVRQPAIAAAEALLHRGRVLGLFSGYTPKPLGLSASQLARLDERESARRKKDFQTADAIRREFQAAGFVIEDTVQGPVVRRRS